LYTVLFSSIHTTYPTHLILVLIIIVFRDSSLSNPQLFELKIFITLERVRRHAVS
jgi:hypothetical protein